MEWSLGISRRCLCQFRGVLAPKGLGNFTEKGPRKSNELSFNSKLKKNVTIWGGLPGDRALTRPASPPLFVSIIQRSGKLFEEHLVKFDPIRCTCYSVRISLNKT